MKKIKIILRKANTTDLKFLFIIYNDAVKKKIFINNKIIDFKSHKKWFNQQAKSRKSLIFIAINRFTMRKVGYIRFNMINFKTWEISIANSHNFQGKGYGTLMLKSAIKKFKLKRKVKLIAIVKKNNKRSQKCFLKNSFKKKISRKFFLEKKISLYRFNYFELNK